MNYIIKITYKDDKVLNIVSSEQECENLFSALNSKKVYWSPENKNGFWTNISDIRYFEVVGQSEENETNFTESSNLTQTCEI